jgi:hypothetical protein
MTARPYVLAAATKKDERGFGAHGHQCSHHFQNFENFKISYFYVFKNYGVKYIDRYT